MNNINNTWPAPAKLNLFLHITGRQANGYHTLQTIFQFLDYGDSLDISVDDTNEISLKPEIAGVSLTDNLIYRAAMLLKPMAKAKAGVQITLDKILPMGAGLGGGSSNAATTLVALNYLWDINLSLEQLAQLGLSLGADVPIFVRGFAAFAEGVGEHLTPVSPPQPYYLVIWPGVAVSTQEIFQAPELPRNTPSLSIEQLSNATLVNDCQEITKNRHPEVASALDWLVEYVPAKMTGTGSCVFGEFRTAQEAAQVLENLPKTMHGFVAKGINTSPLAQKTAQLNDRN